MPAAAILLSILALGPFIGCCLGALQPNAATAATMLAGLIGWAALVLSFLGGLHWGLAMGPAEEAARIHAASGERERQIHIGMAALPPVLGWVALMLPVVTPYWLALALLIGAYIAALVVEHQSRGRLRLPARYMTLRWIFTVVAVAMLTTTLTLRLLGQTIVL